MAVRVAVDPGVTEAEVGETVTEVTTAASTVIVAVAIMVLSEDDVAVIVAEPTATPVTWPLVASTVAIVPSELDQPTVSALISTPFWS